MKNEETWAIAAGIVLVCLALFLVEVIALKWFFGLFGLHFGFWTTAGIIFVIDIVASKFRNRK